MVGVRCVVTYAVAVRCVVSVDGLGETHMTLDRHVVVLLYLLLLLMLIKNKKGKKRVISKSMPRYLVPISPRYADGGKLFCGHERARFQVYTTHQRA